ncbi:hypothetical protein AB0G02_04485 [Actinosynnema sp. NPDC023658]|uniref:hypothetical protein n=1 Tax=Actinosynnema sp. NPDC023658 TaxID=3155465 RepID=UPI0033D8B9DF
MSQDAAHGVPGTTLESLLMRTGALSDVVDPQEVKLWAELSVLLREHYRKYVESLGDQRAGYTSDLYTAYYTSKGRVGIKDRRILSGELLPLVAGFVEKFMERNGQLPYFRGRDWFTSGDFVVAVDVNYYPDRTGANVRPEFHKDTAGINVFANLIFANVQEMEATEWFADLEPPSAQRALWQGKNLPEGYIKELDRARAALAGKDTGPVSGGVTKGQYTYVSWVDDLVWHSTPATSRRVKFTAAAAQRAYPVLDATFDDKFGYVDNTLQVVVWGAELVRSFADDPNTHLHKWMTEKKQPVNDLDTARKAWQAVYRGDAGKKQFDEDAATRSNMTWRITGKYAIANSPDSNLPGSEQILETPAGLSNRKRANSMKENQEALERARAANVGTPRAFIRTWVRLVRKDSGELQGL